ncbi:MAG: SprT-like domain-containing protein [Pyrinomonadaceae bacterium]
MPISFFVKKIFVGSNPAARRRLSVAPVNFYRAAFKYLFLILLALSPASTRLISEKSEAAIFAKEFEQDARLQAEADALLPLFDKMPPVVVYLTDEAIIKSGTNTERGVAYTTCDKNEFPSIYVKKTFYQKANRPQLVNILKHELTHSWLCRQRLMAGHDAAFRRKFTQVGGFGN